MDTDGCYIFGKYEFSAMGLPARISLGDEGELLQYIFVRFDALGVTSKICEFYRFLVRKFSIFF